MRHDPSTPRPLLAGVDSESWTCARCAATMIGHRAASGLCPPCAPPGSGTPVTDRLDAMTPAAATWVLYRLEMAADQGEDITVAEAMDRADATGSGRAAAPARASALLAAGRAA